MSTQLIGKVLQIADLFRKQMGFKLTDDSIQVTLKTSTLQIATVCWWNYDMAIAVFVCLKNFF